MCRFCTEEPVHSFDPVCDIRDIEVCDCPSLSSIIESGVVPASGADSIYNEVGNTSEILGRVRDGFEAVQISRDIRAYQSHQNSAPAPSSVSASSAAPTGE